MLTIPIAVKIRDARLTGVYYVAVFITGSMILAYVIVNELWNSEHLIPGTQIQSSAWVLAPNDSVLQDIMAKKKDAPYCVASQDFWYDWSYPYYYRPSGCLWPCLAEENYSTSSRHQEPCVVPTSLTDTSGDQIFISTMRTTMNTDAFGITQRTSLWFPHADSLIVVFTYNVRTSVPVWSGTLTDSIGHSQKDIITVIIDSRGRIDSVWNKSAQISVAHILKLSGHHEFFDQTCTGHDVNVNKSQKRRYPICRIVGAVITARIHCMGSRSENVDEWVKGWDTTRISFWCTIGFERRSAREWGWRDRTYPNGIGRTQSYHRVDDIGLNLVFDKSGKLYYTNLLELFMMIASIIVFMELPRRFILFFITHCLGNLSTIYKRYLFREASIANAVVGNLIHVFLNAGKFNRIARICKATEAEIGPLLASELEHVLLERSDADKINSDAFAYFVRQTLKDMENNADSRPRCIFGVKKALMKEQSETKREAISIDLLMAAADRSELRTFQDAVDMFGVHRKIGLIERFFQPPFFDQALQCRKLDRGPSTSLPPSTECQQDRNRNEEDRLVHRLSMQELSQRDILIEAADGKTSDLGLEQRVQQHRAEVEEKIQDLRKMIECILERLTRLEVSTVSPGNDIIGTFSGFRENATSDSRLGPGDAMKLIEGSPCVQEPSQSETHSIAKAIEGIEAELKQIQENDALCASTDSEKFPNKMGEGLVAAKKVGATHPPHNFSRSYSHSGQDDCETMSASHTHMCMAPRSSQAFDRERAVKRKLSLSSLRTRSLGSMREFHL